jgi:hypothetical protein
MGAGTELFYHADAHAQYGLRSDAIFNSLLPEHEAVPETHQEDLLYIRTMDGAARICGSGAAKDAIALEQAGVKVYRPPKDF